MMALDAVCFTHPPGGRCVPNTRPGATSPEPGERVRDQRREPTPERLAPKAVVGRVSLYLRQLEAFQRQGQTTISSNQLGMALAIKNAQVRKDLAFFGQFGYPGIGYRIEELITALRRILGIDRDWPLALVGLGNLGRALLRYRGFRSRGFHIVALFDNDPEKIGQVYDGMTVEPIDALPKTLAARNVSMAILERPGRGRAAGGRSDGRLRHPGHLELRPGPAHRARRPSTCWPSI